MEPTKEKTNEELSFELIWHAGNSKSCSMEAVSAANKKDYETAEKKIAEAASELKEAHQIQTDMLHDFANGKEVKVDILMVHAQDHLNGAMITMDFAKQIIEMNKRMDGLEEKLNQNNA